MMQGKSDKGDVLPVCKPQLTEALSTLERIVLDGMRHGFFRCSISSAIGKNNRRELLIEAGKSHKFTIPTEELPK